MIAHKEGGKRWNHGFRLYLRSLDVKTEMLIGLAHDRIMYLGMSYIDRGCVTQDEYENLRVYLYEPYERMGGNGSAKRIMQEVDKLPIHKFIEKEEEHNEHE